MTRLWLITFLLLVTAPVAVATDCSPAGSAAARKQFHAYYAAKDYAKARDTLQPLQSDCFGDDPQGILAASVLSDLAIAAFHAGEFEACAEALAPYAPNAPGYKRRLAGLTEKVRKAIVFNLDLCTATCPMVAATCQSIAASRALLKRAKGDFTAPVCPFPAGGDAVAVPGVAGQCLTILQPRQEVEWGDRVEADPRAVCPRLGLVRQEGGTSRTTEIALPQDSWLRDLEICCVKPILTIARDGRFRLEPEENPPEGCLTGHRTYVVEEIYALDHGKLKRTHKVREGVY